jgi:hypothetical protein
MKSDFGDIVVEPGGLIVQGRQFKNTDLRNS